MNYYNKKVFFLSLFFFFLIVFIWPLEVEAGCCECGPPIIGGNGTQYFCGGGEDNQNFQFPEICAPFCIGAGYNVPPNSNYPIFSHFCNTENSCPIGEAISCCVHFKSSNNIVTKCRDGLRQDQCKPEVTPISLIAKYHGGESCAELKCDEWIGLSYFSALQKPPPAELKRLEFVPQVTIPGSLEFGGKVFSINKGQGIEVNGELLSKYIAILFNWLIGAIGVIVVAYMGFGGMQWLAAAGSAEGINKAKETIRDSMIGLLLVVSSYTVLYFINPRLVGFTSLEVTRIGRIELIADGVEPAGGYPAGSLSSTGEKCEAESELISFPSNITGLTVTASDKRLKPVTRDKLITAASLALALNQGYTLKATSMFRTYAHQEYLYNCYQTKTCNSGNLAAKPNCKTAPHMNGIAVDVCIITPEIDTCSYIKQMYNDGKNAGENSAKLAVAQKKLQEIMKQAGFNRICPEWWHFEAVNWTNNICEPGMY